MSRINCGEIIVAGTKFSIRDRGLTIEKLREYSKLIGASLYLEREPNNEFDPNAIIVRRRLFHLGYIPATLAKHLAPMLDNGLALEGEIASVIPEKAVVKINLIWDTAFDDTDYADDGANYDPSDEGEPD